MFIGNKSVISTRELAGVVATLQNKLNRSATFRPVSNDEKPVNQTSKPHSTSQVKEIARHFGLSRCAVSDLEQKQIGTYIFRLLCHCPQLKKNSLRVVRCVASSQGNGMRFIDAMLESYPIERKDTALLRFEPMDLQTFIPKNGDVAGLDGLIDKVKWLAEAA